MAKIIDEDPATKAAREAEEASVAAAKKKADEDAAEAARVAAEADAKKKADEDAAALAALQAKKAAGEELTDDEKAILDAAPAANEDGVIHVVIGGEENEDGDDGKPAPQWVKELRQQHREQAKRLRELEEENKRLKSPATATTTVGAKPTLEGCGYDDAKFEEKLTAWYESKRKADEAEAAKKAKADAEVAAWQKRLDSYKSDTSKLNAPDFEVAEGVVLQLLDVTQQGIIIQGSDNPRLVVYALGKNPKKAEELAAIKDPLQFAFAVAKLETQMKISTGKKAPPPPEKTLNGGAGSLSGGVDSQLESLRAEAEKTGDYTKVNKYKSEKRKAEAAKQ